MTGLKVKIVNTLASPTPKVEKIVQAAADAINGLFVIESFQTKDGAVLLLEDMDAVEQLLSHKAQAFLASKGLETLQPDWLSTAKTLFIYKLPAWLESKTEQEIIREINKHNNIIPAQVSVIKRKNQQRGEKVTLKVIMKTEENAKMVFNRGIKLFNMSIRSDMIEMEKSNRIRQCYLCFDYSHASKH